MTASKILTTLACFFSLFQVQAQHHSRAMKAGAPISVIDAGVLDELPTQNIADVLRSQAAAVPRLNQMLQTEENQQLLTRLENETSPKIVFLPSPEALNQIPQEQFEILMGDPDASKQFIKQHIIDDKYGMQWGMMYHLYNLEIAADLPTPGEAPREPIDTSWFPNTGALPSYSGVGVNYELSTDYSNIKINGIELSGKYDVATNGTIFELNGMLTPTEDALVDRILENPELSTFYQILALQALDPSEIQFGLMFPGIAGNLTVYAVKDSGFTEQQRETLLDPANSEQRMGFLRSQIAPGFYATNHFFNESFKNSPYGWDTGFTNLNNQPVRVREDVDPESTTDPSVPPRLSYGEWGTQVPGTRGCTVVEPDRVCTDGLLQVTDQPFLLPGAGIQDIFALVPDLAEENYFVNTYHNRGHTFDEGGPYTYFAAVNEGYRSKTNEEINSQYFTPEGFLERFAYAKVPGCFYINQLTDADYESSGGDKIKANEDANGHVWLNDSSRIITGNIACDNGLIHIVDKPLDPPETLEQWVEKQDDYQRQIIEAYYSYFEESGGTIVIYDGDEGEVPGSQLSPNAIIDVKLLPQSITSRIDEVFELKGTNDLTAKISTQFGHPILEIYDSKGEQIGIYSYTAGVALKNVTVIHVEGSDPDNIGFEE